MSRKQPTEAQRQAAAVRREKMRGLANRIGEMSEGERLALAMRACIRTIEGRELSPFNQCMIIMQDEAASVVGGFRQWRAAGRHVRKGGHGLAIWVPVAGPGAGEATTASGAEIVGDAKSKRPRFMLATVFDITQTEPNDQAEHEATPEALEDAPRFALVA